MPYFPNNKRLKDWPKTYLWRFLGVDRVSLRLTINNTMHGIYQDWSAARSNGEKICCADRPPTSCDSGNWRRWSIWLSWAAWTTFSQEAVWWWTICLDSVLKSIREKCPIPMVCFWQQLSIELPCRCPLFCRWSRAGMQVAHRKTRCSGSVFKMSPLEIIPMGYMLIDGGIQTTVQYMSNTTPYLPIKKT